MTARTHACAASRSPTLRRVCAADKSIVQARDDITRLTEQLALEKRLRAQREQYEALAKVISEHAARKQSEV